jgi:hypothetical protein
MTPAVSLSSLPPKRAAKRPRDVRLDFFRGVCLVIIYIAHIFDNPWAQIIPARFGFSDATEIFVFCSGMASAVAFGSVFEQRGMMIGVARIAHRCWQVYWSHIGTFLAVTGLMLAVDRWLATGGSYVTGLGLGPALGQHAGDALLGLLTLTFVPHYFDILPMYLIILALLPAVVGLVQFDRTLAAVVVCGLWLVAATGKLDLPAELWHIGKPDAATWYFNPFSWQLIFLTGFAFMRGWLPAPPVDRWLILAAIVVVAVSVPLSWQVALERSETLAAWNAALAPLIDKTHFGLLRFVHFLALAYLSYVLVGENGVRLKGRVVDWARRLGQQSLAIFMSGLFLSFVASVVLSRAGRGIVPVALVNCGGIVALYGVARIVTWFKSSPWQKEQSGLTPIPLAATATAQAPPATMDRAPVG